MLKIITLSFLLGAFALHLNAQDEKNKGNLDWSIDGGGTYVMIGLSQRVDLQFGVLVSLGRHQFKVAPLFHMWSSEAVNNPKSFSLSGVSLGYFYNLPTSSKRFDLYFKYEMAFYIYNNQWEGTYYDPANGGYQSYSDQSSEFFLGNLIAYGFTYKPSEKIFLRFDFGGGVYISEIHGEFEDYYGLANAQYDFRGYNNVGWFVKSSLALGYSF
ncbi:MAG: hypothetical protein ACI85Q_001244 [Salibacteraceae bacterium]|jgi:hypothetical protein